MLDNIPTAWKKTYGTGFDISRPECLAFANGFSAGKLWAHDGGK